MKQIIHHLAYLVVLILFWVGGFSTAAAAEMSIEASALEPYTGDEVVVTILAHTNESLNATEGVLQYPHDKLSLTEIRDGDSVIHFWVQKEETEPGVFRFSGITTGGFTGPKNNIISLVFTVKAAGEVPLTLTQASLLRNDGDGGNALTTIRNKVLTSNLGKDNTETQYTVDEEVPEYFTPEIIRNQNVYDGAPVLVFATQDKGSGMSHYEVREGRFGFFTKATSPHPLKHHALQKTIYIKAVDVRGNERLVILPAVNPIPFWKYAVYTLIALGVITAILYVIKRLWQKR